MNHLSKSVVREIRTLRSVGAGGGRPPPATRWAAGNSRPYRERRQLRAQIQMYAVRAKLKEAVAYIDRSPKLVHSITSSPAVYERRPPPTSTTTARLIRCSNLDLLARWRDHCLRRFVRTHDQKSVSRAIMHPPASISARCENACGKFPKCR